MRLTTALLLVLFPILVFSQNSQEGGDGGDGGVEGDGGGDSEGGQDEAGSDEKESGGLSITITISGSAAGGDVIIDIHSGHKVHITDSNIKGNLRFGNGCSIRNDMIHECDGSKRQMKPVERSRLRKRVAFLRNQQKTKKSGGKKGKKVQKTKSVSHKKRTKKANRNHVGRHNRMAHRRQKGKAHGRHHKKSHLNVKAARMPGKFSPCNKCHKH